MAGQVSSSAHVQMTNKQALNSKYKTLFRDQLSEFRTCLIIDYWSLIIKQSAGVAELA